MSVNGTVSAHLADISKCTYAQIGVYMNNIADYKVKSWPGFTKGVNLGGWFSQCPHVVYGYENFIVEKDFEVIKSWGCDHIRVPVDYKIFADEEMNFKESGFDYIQRAINWSRKYGLNMILDLHQTYGFAFHTYDPNDNFFTNETYQNFFYNTWAEFAKRFGQYSDTVAFELMNEVTEQKFSATWNKIACTAIARIREYAPTIKVVVGSYWHNSAPALKDLELPKDDPNLVLNFHCYSPMIFTHQGAGWVPELQKFINYPYKHTYAEYEEQNTALYPQNKGAFTMMPDMNASIGVEYFEKQFEVALETAAKYDLPLYCGEYGVIDNADPDESLKWFADIHTAFENHGIGRACWSYRAMNFGLEGPHYAGIIKELVKLL